jgi:hypothetical protein
MFKRREPNFGGMPPEMNQNPYQQGFYQDNQMQRIFYQFEETSRKLRNLNNRLRRIENYLGLRNEDKYDEDLYTNE